MGRGGGGDAAALLSPVLALCGGWGVCGGGLFTKDDSK